ncbi:hypothetical protein ACFQPA_02880 [Halomarina halobia]|uniref:Uncharacterized protein n=1 Tax=Halomarina halobia TaxID=3033386 RepID=A0ABD6A4Z7_9EURY|nr:hypothetical protein [Halomarina sp. PSR21]
MHVTTLTDGTLYRFDEGGEYAVFEGCGFYTDGGFALDRGEVVQTSGRGVDLLRPWRLARLRDRREAEPGSYDRLDDVALTVYESHRRASVLAEGAFVRSRFVEANFDGAATAAVASPATDELFDVQYYDGARDLAAFDDSLLSPPLLDTDENVEGFVARNVETGLASFLPADELTARLGDDLVGCAAVLGTGRRL